ncbi:beta-glucosidase BglX [Ferruginibacter albus]|uniref:beta-glucosidase BglX n=1 Tax=Ferruginibacter albus TaxID=2875540 RepID=UPI001CC64DEC|nr:beta-glucosidase BglX [Ferruginibacter albus]UAY51560.1 beta-glucosidase BglX [Ferruginibacter albus]
MKYTVTVFFLVMMNVGFAQDAAMNKFISDLMQKMTLEEKIGQLNLPSIGFDVTGPVLSKDVESKIQKGLVGGVFNTFTPNAVRKLQDIAVKQTRLKIPLLFGYDVIHGHRTIFPIPLGLAASWDTALIRRIARAAADEATADGLNWTFSPMVDIARDPRWGRVSEGAGEDPFLGSQIAKAMVQGYQGNNLTADSTLMACIKHFALYGAVEAGREYNVVDMSTVKMYNDYLPPYKAGVDAGAGSIMSSFNEINGMPATADKWLMTDLLRKQWGFKGFVATDYTAVSELINHGIGDSMQVTQQSINAGIDMDMVSELFLLELPDLVKQGKVSVATIDNACRLILEAKYKLGLFEDPYRYISEERNKKEIMSADKLVLAKEAALKSIVLLKNIKLKNRQHVLPLSRDEKIAFIGPLVKDKRNLIGSWSAAGDWKNAVSIWEALLQKKMDETLYAKGCNLLDDKELIAKLNVHDAQIETDSLTPQQLIDNAVKVAAQADVVVAVLGESFAMSGEAASRSDIGLPENQEDLLKALKQTGKPIVLVLMNGRPLTLDWENDSVDAIVETWFAGTMAGPAIVDVLFGDYNPSGKITMSYPENVGQIPVYYNHKNTGRPFDDKNKYTSKYLDVSNEPLYPFGYGLSYSSFDYSDMTLNKNYLDKNSSITASVTIANNGNYDGEETAEMYIQDISASITRPLKELKGFQKIYLKKGESKKVQFLITEKDLRFYNADLHFVSEPGKFKIYIGGCSANCSENEFELR